MTFYEDVIPNIHMQFEKVVCVLSLGHNFPPAIILIDEGMMELWELADSLPLSYEHVRKTMAVAFAEISIEKELRLINL